MYYCRRIVNLVLISFCSDTHVHILHPVYANRMDSGYRLRKHGEAATLVKMTTTTRMRTRMIRRTATPTRIPAAASRLPQEVRRVQCRMGLCQTTQGGATQTKRANERVKRMQEGGGGGREHTGVPATYNVM